MKTRCACGAENDATNTFCTECGERLVGEAPARESGDQPAAALPAATQLVILPSRGDGDGGAETRLADAHAEDAARVAPEEQAVPAQWNVGDVILDLYEVKQIHEGGGMGLVYRVHHRDWNTDLALKSPRAEAFETEAQREDFVRECETWIELGMHPHIVSCFYVRAIGDVPHVFAEYVEGGSLEEWIEERRLYEGGPDEALGRMLDIAIQFAWGLHYAHEHEQGLIHQDVKPANVMVTPEGEAKVTDFGLARARAAAGGLTAEAEEGQTILVPSGGMTPAYCSPEQAAGEELSRKTDIWSWGLSVLQMFTGGRTWRSGTIAAEALEEYLKTGAAEESIPPMPEAVAELLKECFRRGPQDRPDDFQEITGRLRAIYEQSKGESYPREEPKAAELLADGLNNRALSMLDLGNSDEAERLFDDALKADPHHLEATYNSGLIRWRSDRISDLRLLRDLEETRQTHDQDSRVDKLMAFVHLERGDLESAVAALRMAHSQAPEDRGLGALLERSVDRLHARGDAVRVFDCPNSDDRRRQLGRGMPLAFSSDNQLAICARSYRVPKTNTSRQYGIAPEEQVVPSGQGRTRWLVNAWVVSTGKCVRNLDLGDSIDSVLGFSPDAQQMLVKRSNMLEVWDAVRGHCLLRYDSVSEEAGRSGARGVEKIRFGAFSRDGKRVLFGERNGLWLLESHSGRLLRKIVPRDVLKWSDLFAFFPSGRFALVAMATHISARPELWDLETGECVWDRELKSHGVGAIAVTSDERFALIAATDGVLVLEMKSGTLVRVLPMHSVGARVLAGCSQFLLCAGPYAGSRKGGGIEIIEIDTGRRLWTRETRINIMAVAISGDGHWVLSDGNYRTGQVTIWRVPEGEVQGAALCRPESPLGLRQKARKVERFESQAQEMLALGDASSAFASVESALSVPGFEKSDRLHELRRRAGQQGRISGFREAWLLHTLEGPTSWIRSICLSHDNRFIIGGCEDSSVWMWDVETGTLVRRFEGHRGTVTALALSADDRILISGSSPGPKHHFVRLWGVGDGASLGELEGHEQGIEQILVSADGQLVLVKSDALRVFDLEQRRCLREFREHWGRGWLGLVVLSPDDRFLLTSHTSGKGRMVLDIARRAAAVRFEVAGPEVRSKVPIPWWSKGGRVASAVSKWGQFDRSEQVTCQVFDSCTGQCIRSFDVTEPYSGIDPYRGVLVVDTEARFLITNRRNVRNQQATCSLWESDTARCLRTFSGQRGAMARGLSPDLCLLFTVNFDHTLGVWRLVWDYEFPERAEWDEGARVYLESFLTLHTPYASNDLATPEGLTRRGKPSWTEEDFQGLIRDLQYAGRGWLRPEGVKRELEKMAADWEGPPPLPAAEEAGSV